MSKILFQLAMPVRWRDMDAFGHVNNATYLGYVEEARVQWFKSLSSDWDGERSAPILAALHMNYRKPAGWPLDVAVELFVERVGGKSLTLGHRILGIGADDTVYADGHAVMVWVDRGGNSVALPEHIRAACTG